jgi:acylphosphatase
VTAEECAWIDRLSTERVRKRVVAHGRVQGVWFREGARRQAERHRLSGWVRNRADGTVEAELEGHAEEVEVVVRWFRHGPLDARVDRLEVADLPPGDDRGFAVR